jgi:hypothetical protein
MASIQKRGSTYCCVFDWQGKRQWLTLGAISEEEADNKAAQADYLLVHIKQGYVSVPAGVDFVERDGRLRAESLPKAPLGLDVLRDKYLRTAARGDRRSLALSPIERNGHR